MHGYGYLQPDSAAHHARNRHQIISHDALALVIPGGLEPVPTSSGFAIPRRGRSGDVRNDRSRRPRSDLGACGCRDFGDVGAAPRASCWARIVSCYLKAEAAPPSASDDGFG